MHATQRCVRFTICALGFLSSVLLHSASAAAEASWVGKLIIPKKGAIDIKLGYEVIGEVRQGSLEVLSEENDWLKVRDCGVEGWIPRDDVVLLDDALEYFTEEIRKDEHAVGAYNRRGVARIQTGEYDSAIEDFNEVILQDPKNPAAYANRGNAWTSKWEYDKAVADYDEALRLDPKNSLAYHNRGYAWHQQDEYDKAIADFSEAVRLSPTDAVSYSWRGNSWRRKGEYEKALGDFNESIRLDPKNARAYNERAWLRATCPDARYRDGNQAVESARRACELTYWKDPAYIDTLAASHAESGDFDEAIKIQTRAIELIDEDQKEDFRSRLALYQARKPYREDVSAQPASAANVVEGNMEFAFDLYSRLRTQDGNLFFSPYSISTALAMTYGGSANGTQAEMAQVLHFPQNSEALHEEMGAIVRRLQGPGTKRAYQLHTANALWAQQDYKFNPAYFSLVEDRYRAALKEVNFRHDPEAARQAINRWVEGQTNHKIKDLLEPGIVNDGTTLVLTIAIFFKAAWSESFAKEATIEEDFFTAHEAKAKVPMMHQTELFRYLDDGSVQLLELPYNGDELSMLVILPKKRDGLEETERSLSARALDHWVENLENCSVEVSLPRFRSTASFSLKGTLQSMGMRLPFDADRADFSVMTFDGSKLYIGAVEHKAYVDVDEIGTEAAAATAVVLAPGAGLAPRDLKKAVFRADHPFIFLIRETTTGSILFMGRVAKPESAL